MKQTLSLSINLMYSEILKVLTYVIYIIYFLESASTNFKNDKVNILLKSDTNNEGCVNWF